MRQTLPGIAGTKFSRVVSVHACLPRTFNRRERGFTCACTPASLMDGYHICLGENCPTIDVAQEAFNALSKNCDPCGGECCKSRSPSGPRLTTVCSDLLQRELAPHCGTAWVQYLLQRGVVV